MRLAGVLIAMALAGCGQSTPSAHNGVGSIEATYSERAVSKAGDAALAAGRGGGPYRELTVNLAASSPNGSPSRLPGFTLIWSPADLSRVEWREVDKYQLLDLATLKGGGVNSVHGARALQEWCSADGEMLTPGICRLPRPIVS